MTARFPFRFLVLLAVLAGFASRPVAAQTKAAPKTKAKPIVTTIYIVRHAEKDSTSNPADPTLSAVGQVRAQALRQALERRHPAALFTTNTMRTRATLAPLAAATKLEPKEYDPRRGRDLADLILKEYAGKSVVIVGHSNNVLSLVDDFGAVPPVDEIGENEYDYLFTVRVAEGVSPTAEVRGYGAERKPAGKTKAAPAAMAPVAPMK
ncbi:phosphoglycerate mutase family protein [Hymenobacter armeniacus]|uniref:Histidine phosphatase family protein n=1 Tax=Hymenobacter armeniacus TaxID=2771358 RepID=A0ABR8JMC7_9BACT|nr:phosphoglycerate mutase family protein [Hymenobacter armeniacus]MBD2721133.1 histidine phosphatase family protein [Hymenobacter armeniacus]